MTRSAALPAVFLLILLLLAGCGGSSAEPGAAASDSTTVDSAEIAGAAARAERARCPAALKVAVMQDKSQSAQEYRTPQLAVSDLAPIIERLRVCGGELAVGLIKAESNRSLTRLYVPRPELDALPEKPSREEADDAFAYNQAMKEYKKARAQAAKARKAARARHRRKVKRRVEAFKSEVAELLKTPADAQHTDVWGGVRRAELYLDEPGAGAASHKAMIIISDARDNQGRPSVTLPLESGAQVLLVNGAPSQGAFEGMKPKPVRLESISSAVRYWRRNAGRP